MKVFSITIILVALCCSCVRLSDRTGRREVPVAVSEDFQFPELVEGQDLFGLFPEQSVPKVAAIIFPSFAVGGSGFRSPDTSRWIFSLGDNRYQVLEIRPADIVSPDELAEVLVGSGGRDIERCYVEAVVAVYEGKTEGVSSCSAPH